LGVSKLILGDNTAFFDRWLDESGVPRRAVLGFDFATFRPGNDGYVAVGDGVIYQTPVSITYTPRSSTSILLVHSIEQVRIIGALGARLLLRRDGVFIPSTIYSTTDFFYKGSTINHHVNLRARIQVNSNNTNPTTFNAVFIPWGGSGEYSNGWGDHFMYIMEIENYANA
jgi:hypothetical protein